MDGHPMDDLDKPFDRESLPLHETSNASGAATSATHTQPTSDARITQSTEFLNGLRGLAAFLVYVYHHISWFYGSFDDLIYGFGQPFGSKFFGQLPFVRVFFTGGNSAVAIFFVLSGYVLSVSPLRSLRGGDAQKCYRGLVSGTIRRPFRLCVPPLGVSFLVVLCMHLPVRIRPSLVWPVPEKSLLLELWRWMKECIWLFNPFESHKVGGRWFMYDPPAYTMPNELLGSWVLFAAVALSSKLATRHRMVVFTLTGVGFLLIGDWYLACFMAGAVLASADQDYREKLPGNTTSQERALHWASFIVGWYLLSGPGGITKVSVSHQTPGFGTLTSLIPSVYYNGEYWRWWHTWGALLLVYGLLRIKSLQRFFSSAPLLYLGRISFVLYLIHMPLLWTFSDRIYRLFGHVTQEELTTGWDDRLWVPDWGIHGLTTRFLLSQSVIAPVNILLAHMGTALLDEPSILIGRWVVSRLAIEKRMQQYFVQS